jgi:hypothetical protein
MATTTTPLGGKGSADGAAEVGPHPRDPGVCLMNHASNHPTVTNPAMTPHWDAETELCRIVDRDRYAARTL